MTVHAELAPHRAIAAGVLHQAIVDLRDPRVTIRLSAVEFLKGSQGLFAWAGVAGLEPGVVIAQARPLLPIA